MKSELFKILSGICETHHRSQMERMRIMIEVLAILLVALAIALFAIPSAAYRIIQARNATCCGVPCARIHDSRVARLSAVNVKGAAGLFMAVNHITPTIICKSICETLH